MASVGRVARLLVRVSGGQPDALPSQDKSRYIGLGAAMLGTASVAAVGMAVMVTQISDLPIPARLAIAAGWGLFVLSIDFVVVTYDDPAAAWAAAARMGGVPERMKRSVLTSAIRTLMRVAFAMVVGIAVAESVVIGVFNSQAVSYLEGAKQDKLLADICRTQNELSRYRPDERPAPDCGSLIRGFVPADPATTATTVPGTPGSALAADATDAARLTELDTQIQLYSDRVLCEQYPQAVSADRRATIGCSGIPGNGPAVAQAQKQLDQLQAEKNDINTRISNQSSAVNAGRVAAAGAEAKAAADAAAAAQAKYDSPQALELLASRSELQKQLDLVRQPGASQVYGLSERFHATEKSVDFWIRWGIRLLFIVADVAPVVIKATMAPSLSAQFKQIEARRQILRQIGGWEADKKRYEEADETFGAPEPPPPPREPPPAPPPSGSGSAGGGNGDGEDQWWRQPRGSYQTRAPQDAGEPSDQGAWAGESNGENDEGSDHEPRTTAGGRPRSKSVSRVAVETRHEGLVPVFEAIGWRTWQDIGIDPDTHASIDGSGLGRLTVYDLPLTNRTHSELYFASHSDFPDFPLVVKCAQRGSLYRARRPSYWPEDVDVPPDIPLRSPEERREAFGFEADAYHLANEMEFARQATHLPHIVAPVVWGHAGKINKKWHAYVAYPYFPRQDLDDFLRADSLTEDGAVPGRAAARLLSPSEFQRVGRSLLVALNGLWLEARQRHRDIKPSNLLVDQNGAVWLTDFEVSSEMGASTTRDRKTPEYCAPEVLLPLTAPANDYVRGMAADAYSVGAVLYTLKTTVFPHWNTVKKHGPGQTFGPWELGAARAVGPPSAPIGMGPGAWAQLSALLVPDPFERLGLGNDGLEKLLKVAEMPEVLDRFDREEIEREEVVRQVELKNPHVLQRALGENALETVSRFLDAEQNGD